MSEPRADRPDMPAYGIGTGAEGLLPWSWATERLTAAWTYWLGTTRPDGTPHLMPVWAVWTDDALLFNTSASSRKGRNLAENPNCSVAVEADRESVVLEGTVTILDREAPLRGRFNALYLTKYDFDMSEWKDPVYVVAPRVAFGFIDKEDRFQSTATRWRFDAP
jgi:PPOX class probable F420-dependent enzyme